MNIQEFHLQKKLHMEQSEFVIVFLVAAENDLNKHFKTFYFNSKSKAIYVKKLYVVGKQHSTLKLTDRLFLHVRQLFHTCLALSSPILASTQEQEGKDEPRHYWNSAHFVVKSCNTHPHAERGKK